jgi:hypothetical protein
MMSSLPTHHHRGETKGENRHVVNCVPTRDGRWHVSCQFAATLTRSKIVYIFCLLVVAFWFFVAPSLGLSDGRQEILLREKIHGLENIMSQKISCVAPLLARSRRRSAPRT